MKTLDVIREMVGARELIMLTKGVDKCKDIASRVRMLDAHGLTIDFNARSRFASKQKSSTDVRTSPAK